jgi:hypothetical protein
MNPQIECLIAYLALESVLVKCVRHMSQNRFAEATRQAAAETNCAYVNVFDTWAMILQRKDQPSLPGNNTNHHNDFGHWTIAVMNF